MKVKTIGKNSKYMNSVRPVKKYIGGTTYGLYDKFVNIINKI